MKLWFHQSRAISELRSAINQGHRRIVVVGPTGSGKGTLATEILRLAVQQGNRGAFFIHRREIIRDIAERLRSVGVRTGVVLPGEPTDSEAPVQVCSIQTLTSREHRPPADVVICDETHHATSRTWRALIESYQSAIVVGTTATPTRGDGRPLSFFEHLIVAAQYSELLAAGLICPTRVLQPSKAMGSNLACDPVSAFQQYTPESKGFCFVASIPFGEDLERRFNEAGVPAKLITGRTHKDVRDRAVDDLRSGALRILINYNVFTEGTDIPDADVCLLASAPGHVGAYLQRCGRVMRAHRSKRMATVLDLPGSSLAFGLPTQDREYSLEGKSGYALTPLPALRICPSCGLTQLSGPKECGGCGFTFPIVERKLPRIYSEELRAVYAFEATPEDARRVEYLRLVDESTYRGYSLAWVVKVYRELFSSAPPQEWLRELPEARRKQEFQQLKAYGASRQFKPGYSYALYKDMFGVSVPRGW